MVKKKEKADEIEENGLIDIFLLNRLNIFWRTIVYTLASIALFGYIGYWLDGKLGTYPVGLIVAVVVSYPITQILLVMKWKKFANEEKIKQELIATKDISKKIKKNVKHT